MLLTTMSEAEINKQIHTEWAKLWDTTVKRLLDDYDKERRKLKIEKERTYVRDYHVKTKGKNTWVICIFKSVSNPKYDGQYTTSVCCAVYYFAEKGTRVMIPCDGGKTSVYNAHFFKRYNERLNLGLEKQLDIIVHFLKYNHDIYDVLLPHGNQINVMGYCRDGFLLGQLFTKHNWLVWKTFVSRDIAREKQLATEEKFIAQTYMQAEQAFLNQTSDVSESESLIRTMLAVKNGKVA